MTVRTLRVFVASIALSAPEATHAVIHYVNDNGAAFNGCTSWTDACPDLQTALGLAGPGDQIWVAAGTYKPTVPNGDRSISFQLADGVELYGGFAGTETALEDRAGLFDQTILSGDLVADDVPAEFPDGMSFADNSFHVVNSSGTDDQAILDGFTISAGSDTRPVPDGRGAGIYNSGGNFSMRNCIIRGNYAFSPSGEVQARGRGGGMYTEGASPTVTECVFTENAAGGAFVGSGAGLYNGEGGTVTVTNSTFNNNRAIFGPWGGEGGGIANEAASAVVSGCLFVGNDSVWGGGMLNVNNGIAVVDDCIFIENTAGYGGGLSSSIESITTVTNCLFLNNHGGLLGGGVSVTNATSTVIGCTFIENHTSWQGGGLYFSGPGAVKILNCKFIGNTAVSGGGLFTWSSPLIMNCLISSNLASETGGGVMLRGNPTIRNCTIAQNAAAAYGGGIDCLGSTPTISNCILWGDDAPDGPELTSRHFWDDVGTSIPSVVTVNYSDIEGGPAAAYLDGDSLFNWGTGMINSDPLFADPDGSDNIVDTEDDDLRLSPGSPCIDAADNTAVPLDVETDLDGNPRFLEDPDTTDTGFGTPPIVDMGAYEYNPCPTDLNGDGTINAADLALILGSWGPCLGCPADFTHDGIINASDLALLLGSWGPCI